MAASTILFRRPSVCLLGGARQYLLKRSHIIIPTSTHCARKFCSSSPSKINYNEPSAKNNVQQPANNQPSISEVLAEFESMKKELETLRKERQGNKEQPIDHEVVVVKEKHPLLKSIELEMAKSDDLNRQAEKLQLPPGFEVESDIAGAASVTLKRKHQDEIITIKLSTPADYVMVLTVKVTLSSGFFNWSEAVFQCTLTSNGLELKKIKEPDGKDHGILFYNLPQDLKNEFHKYLEKRGIDQNSASILYRYMVNRAKRENLRSLEKFKEMVEAA